jgi:hypothetical protein
VGTSDESADGPDEHVVVVLVDGVLVAVFEVLGPGVVRRVLRFISLFTPGRRRSASIIGMAAPDAAWQLPAVSERVAASTCISVAS